MDDNIIQFGYMQDGSMVVNEQDNGGYRVAVYSSLDNIIAEKSFQDRKLAKQFFSDTVRHG